jgi:molybdopterin converting factor small subunit
MKGYITGGKTMNVHVTVRRIAPLSKIFGKKDIDVTFRGNTLKDLIEELIAGYGDGIRKAILDSQDDIDMELSVVVNETDYLSYGERMHRLLNEGDTIQLSLWASGLAITT